MKGQNNIDGRSFRVYMNQAYREARVFHQDDKYAYGVYLTNPKKSNRPFVVKMKKTGTGVTDPFEISGGQIIGLPDGWRIVGNIRPNDFRPKHDDFKDGLVEVLSDTTFWEAEDYQYDKYMHMGFLVDEDWTKN